MFNVAQGLMPDYLMNVWPKVKRTDRNPSGLKTRDRLTDAEALRVLAAALKEIQPPSEVLQQLSPATRQALTQNTAPEVANSRWPCSVCLSVFGNVQDLFTHVTTVCLPQPQTGLSEPRHRPQPLAPH